MITKSFYVPDDRELYSLFIGKEVRYIDKGEISKATLVSINNTTFYFRDITNIVNDVYSVENAHILYNHLDQKELSKGNLWI